MLLVNDSIIGPSSYHQNSFTPASTQPSAYCGIGLQPFRSRSGSLADPNNGHMHGKPLGMEDLFTQEPSGSQDVTTVPGTSDDSYLPFDSDAIDLSLIYNQESSTLCTPTSDVLLPSRFQTPTNEFDGFVELHHDGFCRYPDSGYGGPAVQNESTSLENHLSVPNPFSENVPMNNEAPIVPVVPKNSFAPLMSEPVDTSDHGYNFDTRIRDDGKQTQHYTDPTLESDEENDEDDDMMMTGRPRCDSLESDVSNAEAVVPVVASLDSLGSSKVPMTSEQIGRILPKVDKPELGDLTGKMPRPAVVNTAPRRRKKGEKVTAEDLRREDEERKLKSVLSARDCRKRKKQYIISLQMAIQQYDEREAVAQKLIRYLKKEIDTLKRN